MVSGCIDLLEEHMEWILIWIICGVFSAIIASSKGRSGLGWLVMGLIFGVFALLFVGFMPPSPKEEPPSGAADEKKCPFCAETIKLEAKVCKHCGRDIEPMPEPKGPNTTEPEASSPPEK